MTQYHIGLVIKNLRKKNNITQVELAEKLCVSDKAVSKWETARGYPDISLLESIAKVFKVSVAELLSGNAVTNVNVSANMKHSKFYICPVCGNIIHSMGEAVVYCHGVALTPAIAEEIDNNMIKIDLIEDEYFIRINHEMSKSHYISFIAMVSSDKLQITKLYPEENAEARFKINCTEKIYFYCNRDGLFCFNIKDLKNLTNNG